MTSLAEQKPCGAVRKYVGGAQLTWVVYHARSGKHIFVKIHTSLKIPTVTPFVTSLKTFTDTNICFEILTNTVVSTRGFC